MDNVEQADLDELIRFMQLSHAFQSVERKVLIQESERWENDAEHSFQLALVAWFLAERHGLKLNYEKILKYALAHDLVEAYAGDVAFFDAPELRAGKKQREEEAQQRLAQEFPDIPSLHTTIADYEQRVDEESKFVYALDKILPSINIYIDKGRLWKIQNIKRLELMKYKQPKVALSPIISQYNLRLEERLHTHKAKYFPHEEN